MWSLVCALYCRWFFDHSALSCQPFTYLGSGGNANRFVDRETCMRVCGSGFSGRPSQASCDLPPQFGNGTFKIPRYFFDKGLNIEMFRQL
ncbi:Kunitz/Bovine pancreatic trypsin inhibitor domain protein [Ancylostoma duodenale]|uniref:Kunitz/Bovine pancreatic trypsin inhibitor domain protein n=1 Tax=Ancylostoma duodenale TaxID=51022 RepID=A0A0C2GK08_9BILA|nr:Kunitz/Bovine pancreatic trypsin inhibitor domain protein [Ancylostoma duodenale]